MWDNTLRKITGLRPAQWISMLSDGIAMQSVFTLVFLLRSLWGGVSFELYIWICLALLLGPIIMLIQGSYETPVPPAHKVLKKAFFGVTLTYLVVLIILFMGQTSLKYSRSIMVFSWFITLFVVPIVRGYIQKKLCRYAWWGAPVIFLQDKELTKNIWQELMENPERGLRPVTCIDVTKDMMFCEKIIQDQYKKYISPVFIWLSNRGDREQALQHFEEIARHCKHILIIPPHTEGAKKYWLAPRLLGSTEAFLVRQNLSDSRRNRIKRWLDIVFASVALLCGAPLFLFLIACIRCGSSGPAIYKQKRIGQGGKHISIYKFRTMVKNADSILHEYLHNNPALREEWEKDRKLRNDPRITAMGHFLRKTSLDELPQLFNVLLGTMSLVGPRPIVDDEIERYGNVYLDYTDVKPGITGLWQISGRNNTTYEQRVSYDHYYVTHWSVWMDLWILMRTIPVALRGEGAY